MRLRLAGKWEHHSLRVVQTDLAPRMVGLSQMQVPLAHSVRLRIETAERLGQGLRRKAFRIRWKFGWLQQERSQTMEQKRLVEFARNQTC